MQETIYPFSLKCFFPDEHWPGGHICPSRKNIWEKYMFHQATDNGAQEGRINFCLPSAIVLTPDPKWAISSCYLENFKEIGSH